MTLTPTQCAVAATVIPVLLVAGALEQRMIREAQQTNWFRYFQLGFITFALIATVVAFIGVEAGLTGAAAWLVITGLTTSIGGVITLAATALLTDRPLNFTRLRNEEGDQTDSDGDDKDPEDDS